MRTTNIPHTLSLSLLFVAAACQERVPGPEVPEDGSAPAPSDDDDGVDDAPGGMDCFDPEAGAFLPCDDDGAADGDADVDVDVDDDDVSTPPGGDGEPCDEIVLSPTSLPPRLLLVVDRSLSMLDPADGWPGSKWDGATEAIGSVVSSLASSAELGLMLYADGDQQANVCREGNLAVAPAAATGPAILDELGASGPAGGTPTAKTLVKALGALQGFSDDGGPRVVVLATDGAPNCNPDLDVSTCRCVWPGCQDPRNCLDEVAAVAATAALKDAGYPVFVVGIPGVESFADVLDAMAEAGGTAQSGEHSYYSAGSSAALAAAIESVAARVSLCRYDLGGAVLDVDGMVVTVDGALVPRDPSRTSGWDLVDDDTVELFGAACDGVAPGVEVAFTSCPIVDG